MSVEAGALRVDLVDGRDQDAAIRLATHRGAVAFFDSPEPVATGARARTDARSLFESADFAKVAALASEQRWHIEATMTSDGAVKLARYTTEHIGHVLVIAWDGTVVEAPIVRSAVLDGRILIDMPDDASANDLAADLKSGPLPFTPVITAIHSVPNRSRMPNEGLGPMALQWQESRRER